MFQFIKWLFSDWLFNINQSFPTNCFLVSVSSPFTSPRIFDPKGCMSAPHYGPASTKSKWTNKKENKQLNRLKSCKSYSNCGWKRFPQGNIFSNTSNVAVTTKRRTHFFRFDSLGSFPMCIVITIFNITQSLACICLLQEVCFQKFRLQSRKRHDSGEFSHKNSFRMFRLHA